MIQTVTGPIRPGELGVTLPHEHLLIELRPLVPPPLDPARRAVFDQPLSLQNLGETMNDPYAVLDNAVLDDEDIAAGELLRFKQAGGATLVDVTLRDIGRRPQGLRSLSRRTGVQIVAGCGYYVAASHPPGYGDRTVEDIAGEMAAEIRGGMDGTDIRAGVIGEIGTGDPVTENEWKTLDAAALAHRVTGAAIHVHTAVFGTQGLAVLRRLTCRGVPADKVCIDHVDVVLRPDYMAELCRAGAFIEFDDFGKEYYIPGSRRHYMLDRFAYDLERVRALKGLIRQGYADHLLITNDICLKSLLHAWGGRGYDHILKNVVPMMEDEGIPARDIDRLLIDNPARLLDM